MESQMVTLFRNLQMDVDNHSRYVDDKFKLLERPTSNRGGLDSELEYIKGVNEALEEERKRDNIKNKQFVNDKAQALYDELDNNQKADMNDVNRKFQQLKVEYTEALVEMTDSNRREHRDMKQSIEENTNNIEFLLKQVKGLRKRGDETDRLDSTRIRKSDSQLSVSMNQKVDGQFDDKLNIVKNDLKDDIKREYEQYVDEAIEYNNKNYVLPTIENQCDQSQSYTKRSPKEVKASFPNSSYVNDSDLEARCEKIMQRKLRPECKKILNDELDPIINQKINQKASQIAAEVIDQEVPEL